MAASVAIIARNDNASPKILAQGLEHMLDKLGVTSHIYWGADALLRRLLPLTERPLHWYLYPHRRLQQKLIHWQADRRLLRELREYSAIVFCECIPNAMWRNYYDIESLRRRLPGIPILLYEVYYLGNAPSQLERLKKDGDFEISRYDWHLAVSEVTETRCKPSPPWSAIGLDLEHTGMVTTRKKDFTVVVDFAQPGYEHYRDEQLAVLRSIDIDPIILQGRYSLEEIREIYKRASIFLLQFPESFGVSIAECLGLGVYVFTPDSGWPMAFRLDENPRPHGPGKLPEVFWVYRDATDLKQQLLTLRASYHPDSDPFQVFEVFQSHYPTYWQGDLAALKGVVHRIEMGELRS